MTLLQPAMGDWARLAKKYIRRLVRRSVVDPLRAVILGFFYLMSPVLPVKLLLLGELRIGELAGCTDLFLRRIKLGIIPKPRGFYAAVTGKPCNEQLLKMFGRQLPIIQNKYLHKIVNTPMLRNSPFVERLPFAEIAPYSEYNDSGPLLSFSEAEEERGQMVLREMGIPEGAWFVCFHARDSAYLQQQYTGKNMDHTSVRNSSIENCFDAMKYITENGGYALRMGSVVSDSLPDLGNAQIIDYASNYRSEFGDIYLIARSKFYVGQGGLIQISHTFNVPVVDPNALAFALSPLFGARDLYIPVHIYSIDKDRRLTFHERMASDICYYYTNEGFERNRLQVLENSAEDILAVTREMNERLDETFVAGEEDEALQDTFRALFGPHHIAYGMPGRVGSDYLRAHRDLLE
ncbi:TIGR04372 family glycosyltransferase [Dehalococcoidia bacterium]|nr:TIGR04372 family glycosyltransferase [Dehalococcoidia bacterium]